MDAFEGLADPVRRAILRSLADGPARVVDLAAAQTISRPAVSRHLLGLARAGLVEAEDRGRERHYRLRPEGLQVVAEYVEALRRRPPAVVTDQALDALDTEVRRTARERRQRPARGRESA